LAGGVLIFTSNTVFACVRGSGRILEFAFGTVFTRRFVGFWFFTSVTVGARHATCGCLPGTTIGTVVGFYGAGGGFFAGVTVGARRGTACGVLARATLVTSVTIRVGNFTSWAHERFFENRLGTQIDFCQNVIGPIAVSSIKCGWCVFEVVNTTVSDGHILVRADFVIGNINTNALFRGRTCGG
jgi:hypothetical protein